MGTLLASIVSHHARTSIAIARCGGLMCVTRKAVIAELAKRRHNAVLVNGGGYFYFIGGDTADWWDRTVMVTKISSLSLEQWMPAFQDLKNKNAEIQKDARPKRTGAAGE